MYFYETMFHVVENKFTVWQFSFTNDNDVMSTDEYIKLFLMTL